MVEHGRIAAIETDQRCPDFGRCKCGDARADGARIIECYSDWGGGRLGLLQFRVVERQQVRDVGVRCALRQFLQHVQQIRVWLDVGIRPRIPVVASALDFTDT